MYESLKGWFQTGGRTVTPLFHFKTFKDKAGNVRTELNGFEVISEDHTVCAVSRVPLSKSETAIT